MREERWELEEGVGETTDYSERLPIQDRCASDVLLTTNVKTSSMCRALEARTILTWLAALVSYVVGITMTLNIVVIAYLLFVPQLVSSTKKHSWKGKPVHLPTTNLIDLSVDKLQVDLTTIAMIMMATLLASKRKKITLHHHFFVTQFRLSVLGHHRIRPPQTPLLPILLVGKPKFMMCGFLVLVTFLCADNSLGHHAVWSHFHF